MSEVKDWLMSIGIPGIERLSDEFESRGFTTMKSLQYLKQGDLDYIFSSPKRLLLAEKRALDTEIHRLQEGGLQPRQLTYNSSTNNQGQAGRPTISTPATQEITDSPLERRRQELVENLSFLEVQISSAEEHLATLKQENDCLQTVTRGRICSRCHLSGHNKNSCSGIPCESHTKCKLKDKHPELGKSISETQKNLALLRKSKETAKLTLDQFIMQIQRSRGNFFAIMRPRLKRLNPMKYISRQELDKDLLYLQKALENKIPPETEDWRLPHLLENTKGQLNPLYVNFTSGASQTVISPTFHAGGSAATSSSMPSAPGPFRRFHPYERL